MDVAGEDITVLQANTIAMSATYSIVLTTYVPLRISFSSGGSKQEVAGATFVTLLVLVLMVGVAVIDVVGVIVVDVVDFWRLANVALQPSEWRLPWWQHVHLLLAKIPGWKKLSRPALLAVAVRAVCVREREREREKERERGRERGRERERWERAYQSKIAICSPHMRGLHGESSSS